MSIATTVDHYEYKGTIYSTDFVGEHGALARSDFLRPLLPPENRRYITLRHAQIEGRDVCGRIISANLKHGGIRVRVIWAGSIWSTDTFSRDEIIGFSRRVLTQTLGRPQVLANWPFPIGSIAA